jgi:phosphoglycolate phosphatase
MIQSVLFDLDGTLSDSAPGILASLRATFEDFDVPWLTDAEARAILGPPFWKTLPPIVGADRVEAVIERYRHHYVDGGAMFDTEAYDGIAEVVSALKDKGIRLAVATSKPEPHAARIVEHLELHAHFEHITGDTLDGRRDSKALVVGEALSRLGVSDPSTVLMVGDRSHDVLGAAAHTVACVGVLWGYGSEEELTTAGAVAVVDRPSGLLEFVS